MTEITISTKLTQIVNAQRTDILRIENQDPLLMMYDLIAVIKDREAQIDDLLKRVAQLENDLELLKQ